MKREGNKGETVNFEKCRSYLNFLYFSLHNIYYTELHISLK